MGHICFKLNQQNQVDGSGCCPPMDQAKNRGNSLKGGVTFHLILCKNHHKIIVKLEGLL